MKNRFCFFLASILLSFSWLIGCDKNDAPKSVTPTEEDNPYHEHSYYSFWDKDETSHWHRPSCSHSDAIKDKADHTFSVFSETPATYASDGVTVYMCTVCGYTKRETIPQLTHTFDEEFSFNENGHWYACSDEGFESLKKDYQLHDIELIEETESTFETQGEIKFGCKDCDYEYTVTKDLVEHTYDSEFVGDSSGHWHCCIDEGYEELISGFSEHNYETSITAATFDRKGSTTYTCVDCGYSYSEDINQLEHSYDINYSYDEFHHYRSCIDIGYEDLFVDKEAHSYINYIHDATYEEEGYIEHVCSVCGYTYKDSFNGPLEHHYSDDWSKDTFNHWHDCIDVGYENLKGDYAPHDFIEDVHEPTFTEYGWVVLTCKDCGVSYIRYGEDYKKHTYEGAYESNEDGHWRHCSDEGYEYLVSESEPHELGGNWIVDSIPTATSTGQVHRECTKCHRPLITRTLPACSYSPTSYFNFTYYSSTDSYGVSFKGYSISNIIVPAEYDGRPVTRLETFAFNGCSSIQHVYLPDSLTYIGQYALRYTSISDIYLPDGVTEIGDYAFEYCSSLSDIRLSTSLNYIGSYVFRGCSSLVSVELPDSLLSLSPYCFYNCTSLKNVKLSASMSSIPSYCFYNCAIDEMVLPLNLDYIYYNAFYNNGDLRLYSEKAVGSYVSVSSQNNCNYIIFYYSEDEVGPPGYYRWRYVDGVPTEW